MLHCYVTDRAALGGIEALLDNVRRVAASGVDMIQIREKDLTDRELLALVRRAVELTAGSGVKVLVNGRPDIALASGAQGVHLPAGSIAPERWRRRLGERLLIGVSCHGAAEVREAERDGAGFVLLGPIFPTASKAAYGPPLGLGVLREAVASVRLPVLALGGISLRNAADCIEAGAAGIAGISLFQVKPES